ncbi:GyrI-like domain-containing protein [Paenibacillus hamazuiensis]|uniref:GyrI-like domain-containing protein n=1 Tax=Paenibacillus hamazuiensis TaxID=2936508 RepID=UPI00200BCB79|nr:GyrI-like domain-containing protein [Paenibacillus hamazuiensis]
MAIDRQRVHKEDVKKLNKTIYSIKDLEATVYDIPEMNYIFAHGNGARNIYRMYDYKEIWTMGRFINRSKYYTVGELGKNYSRMPLEMEWGEAAEQAEPGTEVPFTAMMWIPEYVSEFIFDRTLSDLRGRLGELGATLQLGKVSQGTCAQLMHFGHYSGIGETVRQMRSSLEEQGYVPKGRHREIFMNHPHCNPPEKLQILIRQPLEPLQV